MTELDKLEKIAGECEQASTCEGCPWHDGKNCTFARIFHSKPYKWNLSALAAALKAY